MDELLKRMDDQMAVRGLAPATRETYLRNLRRLARYYDGKLRELNYDEVESFLLHLLRDKGLAATTRNQYVAAFRFFFGRTVEAGDWVHSLPRARETSRLPVVLSGTEVSQLIDAFRSPVHRAIASLCYGAGLRVSEACGLHIEDIDGKRRRLHVRRQTKLGKHRQLPLGRRLHHELRVYYVKVRPNGPQMFPGRGSAPITREAFHLALKRAAAAAGIEKRVSAHVLRHSYATHMIEAGADLRSLQLLLGHANLETTTIYVHLTHARQGQLPNPLDLLGTRQAERFG